MTFAEVDAMVWQIALRSPSCGGPYSESPCRAKTCNPAHPWCWEHRRLAPATCLCCGAEGVAVSPLPGCSSVTVRYCGPCHAEGRRRERERLAAYRAEDADDDCFDYLDFNTDTRGTGGWTIL